MNLMSPSRSDVDSAVFSRHATFKIRRFAQSLSLLLAGVLIAFTPLIQAAITISPVIVDVPPDGRAIITVRNDRQREVMYQITFLRWVQVDGVDRYEATQDFIASPPLFTLAANDSQIIRMGFRNPVRLPVEQSYRLILAEVPRGIGYTEEGGVVEFSMQYAIPVFVASSNRAGPLSLVWQMREEGGALVVRADNPSSTHTVLNMVGLTRESGANPKPEFASPQRATVLAHAWREWRFSVAHDKLHLPWRIVVLQNDGETMEVVPDADVRPKQR
jgi:fimbrial chaperone protein